MKIDIGNGWELDVLKDGDEALLFVLARGQRRAERRIEQGMMQYAKGPALEAVLRGAAQEIVIGEINAMPNIDKQVEEVLMS